MPKRLPQFSVTKLKALIAKARVRERKVRSFVSETDRAWVQPLRKALLQELTSLTNLTPSRMAWLARAMKSLPQPLASSLALRSIHFHCYRQYVRKNPTRKHLFNFIPVGREYSRGLKDPQ